MNQNDAYGQWIQLYLSLIRDVGPSGQQCPTCSDSKRGRDVSEHHIQLCSLCVGNHNSCTEFNMHACGYRLSSTS